MKKKLIYTTMLVAMLALSVSCGKTKSDSKNTSATDVPLETTAVITNPPLPTAEVSVAENSDGTSQLDNTTAGYNVSYDSKLLEMNNKDNTISFAPSDEKAKEEMNLFLSITETDVTTAKELGKQLKKGYKGSIKKSETTLGMNKTPATFYNISDSKKVTHEVYIISSEEKGWYIELKCPSKYEKKYLTAFEDILGSMDFSATIEK